MTRTENLAKAAIQARAEGRFDDALLHVQAAYLEAVADDCDRRTSDFIPLLEWEWLAECHPPAREALARERDAQAVRLLAGELTYGGGPPEWPYPRSRFALVVRMDEALKDAGHTYRLFAQLDSQQPDTARRGAQLALEAVVAAGDFALGERYLPEPMAHLDELNEVARSLPLFPPAGTAPRLCAELSGFAKDLRLRAAILRGLGREEEAESLLRDGLAGLDPAELRDWARREIASPGAISKAIVAQHMAQDAAAFGSDGQP